MLTERTTYVPKSGQFDAVLATRRRACAVRRAIGLRPGRITIETDRAEGPACIQWQCDFPDDATWAADLDARAASAEFEAVRATMRELIDRFDRQVLRPVPLDGSVLTEHDIDGVPVAPEECEFESDGRMLRGYLFRPPGEGPFPCMVINHGSGIHQGSTDWCNPGVAAMLMSWGLAAFLPHRRGYGNSPGTPWREDVSAEYGTDDYDMQLSTRLDAESDDVVAARAFLAALPDIDETHIGVMGSSFGGTNTLLAAAKEPAFNCAVEFAGAAMNWDRTPALRELMTGAAARLTQPVFFAQAANDYSIRPTKELAASLEGTGKIVRSRVYPALGVTKDEGHFLFGRGVVVWGRDVREFLEAYL